MRGSTRVSYIPLSAFYRTYILKTSIVNLIASKRINVSSFYVC